MSRASEAVTAAGGWRKWFTTARGLPSNASPAEKANRGREFEAALVEMLSEAKLQPRKGYRPIGEEIDGSFWLDGRTYLFEAKWTSAAHPASSLYQFKGKVEGKLTGTVGLFFSMSGYSPDAVQALVAGKNLNLVLFDDSDINLLFEEEIDIAEAIRLKVRAAAESGTPYIQLDAVRAAATRGRSPVRDRGRSSSKDASTGLYWSTCATTATPRSQCKSETRPVRGTCRGQSMRCSSLLVMLCPSWRSSKRTRPSADPVRTFKRS
ncbi:hypothetical protein GS688_00845 [Rhodococcus hoagii]|nr:hypothetical protein [Prescottella equi]NKT16269.1 hypothetical protein [Prescottella equi]